MKRLKDRKDAKRVTDITGMSQILIDLKPDRCDSDVYINQKMDVTKLVAYIEEKKKTNADITYFHAFVAAIGKLFYTRNKLNRFVANRHVYEHNDIVISFVAKVSFEDHSEEMMVMVPINENDNINTISDKIKKKVSDIRDSKKEKEGANNAIDVLAKLPNFLRIPIVGTLKWCDKRGILPNFLIHDNLYYSSIIVSNLGSIRCNAIYHNITNFGSCSALATMGEIKENITIDNNKQISSKQLCEFGINLDERIADGYYFVKSIQLLQYIFDNPELLEEEASKVVIKKEKDV